MCSFPVVQRGLLVLALVAAGSNSQPCTTVVLMQSLPSGLALATFQNGTNTSDDVTVIIGRTWNVSEESCVEFQFDPGTYRARPLNVDVTYNVVLTSKGTGVTIWCTEGSYNRVFGFSKYQGSVTVAGLTFLNCTGSLMFDNLNNLTITDSTFRNFRAPPIDVFNCWHVEITNSIFANSNASNENAWYRGDSGGISAAFNSSIQDDIIVPYLKVVNCTFQQNTAYYPFNDTEVYRTIFNNSYAGRGGGMALLMNEERYNVTVLIENCTFAENNANYSGGGLFVTLSGNNTYHSITVSNCLFNGNSAQVGGGTHMVFENGFTTSLFMVTDCRYENNEAEYGGAISTLRLFGVGLKGNQFSLINTVFTSNKAEEAGSAVSFFSYQYPFNAVKPYSYIVRNCTYVNNESPQGALVTSVVNLELDGTIYFRNNTGPSLVNIGSLITVNGSILFECNNATSYEGGGALFITGFGQMLMMTGASMEFVDNVGRIGAAIMVAVQDTDPEYSAVQYNPQCFLIFEEPTSSPLEDHNVTILFKGNTAEVGSAIYISHLNTCSWVNSTHENATFDPTAFPKWSAFKFEDNTNTEEINDTTAYDVQTEAAMVYTWNSTQEVVAYPGQLLNLSIVGKDEFNNPTFFIAWLKEATGTQIQDASNFTQNADVIIMNPALLQILPTDITITTAPVLAQPSVPPNSVPPNSVTLSISAPYNVQDVPQSTFNVTITNCKPGYLLTTTAHSAGYMCQCASDDRILACVEDNGTILLEDGYWAGVVSSAVSSFQLIFVQCPAGYCNCRKPVQGQEFCTSVFYQTDVDNNTQCHGTRKGLLCGECIDGLSIGVLRYSCRNCSHDTSKYSLAILTFVDVSMTLLILFVSAKYHTAFPAGLKGLLFYVQTVYWSTEYIAASCWDVRQYVLYITSTLSLYFPWDFCLYPGATALQMAAVQFITPIIVTVTTLFVFLVFKRWRGRLWNGIMTLLLLLYPSLIHNCASLVQCTYLAGGDGYQQRWFYDGSVQCYADWPHTVLAVVSIVLLITMGAIIPITLIIVLYTSMKEAAPMFDNISRALSEGYKCTTAWWFSIDLLRRYLLLILLASFPGRTVIFIYVLIATCVAQAFVQPYTTAWHNFTEMTLLCYYVIILLANFIPSTLYLLTTHLYPSIPIDRGLQLASYDTLTWIFATLFYIPLALAGITWGLLLLRLTYKYITGRRSKSDHKTPNQNDGDMMSYQVTSTVIDDRVLIQPQ